MAISRSPAVTGDGILTLGQETWNIADGFTKIKILRILIEIDLYENLALFGYQAVEDREKENLELVPQKRVEALHRILFDLSQLLGNCKFAIHDRKDKIVVDKLKERLNLIEKYIDGAYTVTRNFVTNEETIVINEEHFRRCFNIMRDIKDELNFPVNNAGLIFRQTDTTDLDSLTKDLIEGG